jgi:hypothetical protein
VNTATTSIADSVDTLTERIAALVGERQSLRACAADGADLEENRLRIASMQRRLSAALIRDHLPAAA